MVMSWLLVDCEKDTIGLNCILLACVVAEKDGGLVPGRRADGTTSLSWYLTIGYVSKTKALLKLGT